MNRLPDTTGMRDEAVVVRSQRNFYDHAVRAAGAHLVEVGLADRFSGAVVRDAEPWEIDDAIGERTACVFYVAQPSRGAEVERCAGAVDAGQLPPLATSAASSADLVDQRWQGRSHTRTVCRCSSTPRPSSHPLATSALPRGRRPIWSSISGGKAILGPQGSGILCGRRDLVASALLQNLDQDLFFEQWRPPSALFAGLNLRGLPQHGIGRSCKVGKEQIVALLVGLGRFVEEDIGERNQRCLGRLKEIEAHLDPEIGRVVRIEEGANGQEPCLVLEVAPGPHGHSASVSSSRCRTVRPPFTSTPRSWTTAGVAMRALCLKEGDARVIARRVNEVLGRGRWNGNCEASQIGAS